MVCILGIEGSEFYFY